MVSRSRVSSIRKSCRAVTPKKGLGHSWRSGNRSTLEMGLANRSRGATLTVLGSDPRRSVKESAARVSRDDGRYLLVQPLYEVLDRRDVHVARLGISNYDRGANRAFRIDPGSAGESSGRGGAYHK